MARRCDGARSLAFLVAQSQLIDSIRDSVCNSRRAVVAPNQACSTTKVAENVYPYIIAMFHFFEKYRAALATSAPTSAKKIKELLAQYNKETAYRIRCLYHLLLEIIKQKFPPLNLLRTSRLLNVPCLTDIARSDRLYLEMFVFGGLEAVTDIIAQTSLRARRDHLIAHYAATTAISALVTDDSKCHLIPLPKPLLPKLDYKTTTKISCRLSRLKWLFKSDASIWGESWFLGEGAAAAGFLEYLVTHEGAEPELMS